MITHQDNQFIYDGIAVVPCPSEMCIDSANSYDDSLHLLTNVKKESSDYIENI